MAQKSFFLLSLVLATLILIYSFPTGILAYPQDQFNECLLAAKSNPDVNRLPIEDLKLFCDCAIDNNSRSG